MKDLNQHHPLDYAEPEIFTQDVRSKLSKIFYWLLIFIVFFTLGYVYSSIEIVKLAQDLNKQMADQGCKVQFKP